MRLASAAKVGSPPFVTIPNGSALKHTAITRALQGGASVWDCAGFFSTSPETIEKVYGHHSPDFQESALRAMERGKKWEFLLSNR